MFLSVHGALLFNLLPKSLRNENSGDSLLFKNHLDIFLSGVPDQPTMPGLVRAAVTNSLRAGPTPNILQLIFFKLW